MPEFFFLICLSSHVVLFMLHVYVFTTPAYKMYLVATLQRCLRLYSFNLSYWRFDVNLLVCCPTYFLYISLFHIPTPQHTRTHEQAHRCTDHLQSSPTFAVVVILCRLHMRVYLWLSIISDRNKMFTKMCCYPWSGLFWQNSSSFFLAPYLSSTCRSIYWWVKERSLFTIVDTQ